MSAPVHQPPSLSPLTRLRLALAVIGLALLTLAAYHNSFSVPFVFDDVPTILENRSVRQLSALGEVLWPRQSGGVTTSGRPVVNLSFAINHAFSGYDVRGYHATNLLVHLGAGLCLFGIIRRTLASPPLRARFGSAANGLAWLTAALWTVHPLQTESVTYIVQRAESLAGLLYLLTLYTFIRAIGAKVHLIGESQNSSRAWLAASVSACFLGMATKEIMASAPLIVLLYDRTFVAGTFTAAWRARRGFYCALAATWILLGALILATGSRGGTAGFGTAMSSWDYALTQCRALGIYSWLSVWPEPLVFDYGLATVSGAGQVVFQALLIIGVLIGVLVALRRRSSWGFVGAMFFAVLAPSSSVVPVATQTMAEHRMYLPLALLVTSGVVGGYALIGPRSLPAGGALALGLALCTFSRNHDYRSAAALWADTVAKLPTNARAHNNLGRELFRDGDVARAMAHYERALALQPGYPESHYNLGVALAQRGDLPQAVAHYETALGVQPHYPEAHNNLGNALVRAGRLEEANRHYDAALAQDPDFAEAHNNRGNARLQADRPAEAITCFETALRLKPDYPEARYNLGNALASMDRMTEALQQYRTALALKPDYAEAHVNAGNALLALEKPGDAIVHYEKALSLNPQLAEAANNLGTVYLHTGRVAEAVAQFERALAARPDFAAARENLKGAHDRLRQSR